jgi:endonuclease-3
MAEKSEEELIPYIRSCGFYRNKAKSIIASARSIMARFGGEVPQTVEELVTLEGVGRKTANVVYSVAFGGDAIPVDTHVFRLAHRLGLSEAKTPDGVEKDLNARFEKDEWSRLHHLLIHHGRYVCNARNPRCNECSLADICPSKEN